MKQTRLIMGMPITVEVVDEHITTEDLEKVFLYFIHVDRVFSIYKKKSEISRINSKELSLNDVSSEVREILQLAKDTKEETNGYFDIEHHGQIDPSGIVKGWAVYNAGLLLKKRGFKNFYIDAGGDIEIKGCKDNSLWRVGIRSPFNREENVKVLAVTNCGVATSGTAIRGQHIYNPHNSCDITDIVSLTVIGPNIYDADRFATAAFAMGKSGINFIENLDGFEGYMIDEKGTATFTSQFEKYVL